MSRTSKVSDYCQISKDLLLRIIDKFKDDYYRDCPTVWKVVYEYEAVGFCTEFFLTRDRLSPPTAAQIKEAVGTDIRDGDIRSVVTIESISVCDDLQELDEFNVQMVYAFRRSA